MKKSVVAAILIAFTPLITGCFTTTAPGDSRNAPVTITEYGQDYRCVNIQNPYTGAIEFKCKYITPNDIVIG